jgi:hypothetical protein
MPIIVFKDLLKKEDSYDNKYNKRDNYSRGVYRLYDNKREDLIIAKIYKL